MHFKVKPTKFGSPYLDTPNSRYEFLKFAFKSMKKIIKKIKFQIGATARCTRCIHPATTDDRAPRSTQPHATERQRQGLTLTGEKLTDGKVTSGSVTTDVFPNSTRTYRYPQFAWRITGASMPVSMEARRDIRWCSGQPWRWHG